MKIDQYDSTLLCKTRTVTVYVSLFSALSKLNLLGGTGIIIPILKLILYESIDDKVDVNKLTV